VDQMRNNPHSPVGLVLSYNCFLNLFAIVLICNIEGTRLYKNICAGVRRLSACLVVSPGLFVTATLLCLAFPMVSVYADTGQTDLRQLIKTTDFADMAEKDQLRQWIVAKHPDLDKVLDVSQWQTVELPQARTRVPRNQGLSGRHFDWLQITVPGTARGLLVVVTDGSGNPGRVIFETDLFQQSGYFYGSYWLKLFRSSDASTTRGPLPYKIYVSKYLDGHSHPLRQLRLYSEDALTEFKSSINLAMSGYFGALLALLIYNLGFALRLKSRLHGLYATYCSASLIYGLSRIGLLYDEAALPFGGLYHRTLDTLSTGLLASSIMVFTLFFLDRKFQWPRVRQLVWLFLMLTVISPFGYLLEIDSYAVVKVFNFLAMSSTLLVVVMVLRGAVRGSWEAWLLIVAFMPVPLIGLGRIFSQDWGFFLQNGIQITLVVEALVLSYGLTERVRRIRENGLKAMAENAARSDYFANMAHELRTPLNAIIGFSDALKSGYGGKLASRQEQYIGDIHDAGNHLLTLINDVLDMSKSEAGKLELFEEEVDVGEQVLRSLPFVREQAQQAHIRLIGDIEPDLASMRLDARVVRQMVVNLLSNAVKFTPANGQVTVTVRRADDGDLLLIVKDTGQGMSPEDIPVALSPYGQTTTGRHMPGSTGLGLPLVKSMAELHGGTVLIESEVGKGTTATIRLPGDRFVESSNAIRVVDSIA